MAGRAWGMANILSSGSISNSLYLGFFSGRGSGTDGLKRRRLWFSWRLFWGDGIWSDTKTKKAHDMLCLHQRFPSVGHHHSSCWSGAGKKLNGNNDLGGFAFRCLLSHLLCCTKYVCT